MIYWATFFSLLHFTAAIVISSAFPHAPKTVSNAQAPVIIYLADESIAYDENNLRSVESLGQELSINYVSTWKAFSLLRHGSLQAVIIDVSALDNVNEAVIARLYQRGVVIASFNIPIEEFSGLVNDRALLNNGFASEPYPGSFFIMASQLTPGNLPTEVAPVSAAQQSDDAAEPHQEGSDYFVGYRGLAANVLDTREDVHAFSEVLLDKIQDIAETRLNFNPNPG